MIPLGILIVFAGYGVGSWGYCLVKGWDISLRQWFSPLNPWTWPPPGQPVPNVPQGHVFPPGSQTGSAGEGGGGPVGGGPPGHGGGQPGGGTIPA